MPAVLRRILFGAVAAAGLAQMPAAQAQQTSQASVGLEEIVVTARRREENIQTVPISVTAFGAEAIKSNNLEAGQDLQHLVPSLVVTKATRDSDTFTIRAQRSSAGGASVATYFAEVSINNSGPGNYFDLENLSVLKGPQGTLFGKGTTGGAVLIVPQKPTDKLEGYIQATAGNFRRVDFEGAINVPIVADKLLLRLSGAVFRRNGFTKGLFTGQDLDDRNYDAERAAITVKPSETLESYFLYDRFLLNTNGTGNVINLVNPTGPAALVFGISTIQSLIDQQRRLGIRTELGPGFIQEYNAFRQGITNITRWEPTEDFAVKNIASYRVTRMVSREDLDGTPMVILDRLDPFHWEAGGAGGDSYNQYTEELQFSGKLLDRKLDWIVGGYLEFIERPNYFGSVTVAFRPGTAPPSANERAASYTIGHNASRSQAVFGQVSYDLSGLSDALTGLKLTGGYRYTRDFKSSSNITYNGLGACSNSIFADANCVTERNGKFHAGGYTFGLDYQVTDGTLLYVTARRAYMPGGFNTNTRDPALIRYQAQYVRDVEAGVKSDWELGGMKARTNAAFFYDWMTNMQVTTFAVDTTVNAFANFVTNRAKARVKGFEFDGILIPVDGLELGATVSFNNAKWVSYTDALGDHTGDPFPYTQKKKYSLSAKYILPVMPQTAGTLSVSGNWAWQGRYQFAPDFQPGGTEDPYGLLNLRVDWNNVAGNPLDLSFFMTNVTNKAYRTAAYTIYPSAGYSSDVYGEPRMWGFQLRYRWQP